MHGYQAKCIPHFRPIRQNVCRISDQSGKMYVPFQTNIAEGLAQWLRSLPPNPEVPGSIPGLVEGWIFGWPSFPLKFTQLSILPGSVKWVPAYMGRFEAAARGAYVCFRSAGGKLIIVNRLWACYMLKKTLYKCTTLIRQNVCPISDQINRPENHTQCNNCQNTFTKNNKTEVL